MVEVELFNSKNRGDFLILLMDLFPAQERFSGEIRRGWVL